MPLCSNPLEDSIQINDSILEEPNEVPFIECFEVPSSTSEEHPSNSNETNSSMTNLCIGKLSTHASRFNNKIHNSYERENGPINLCTPSRVKTIAVDPT